MRDGLTRDGCSQTTEVGGLLAATLTLTLHLVRAGTRRC
jgi:hypothetical protein